MKIQSAAVLAAGFGKRLQPLTDRIPKPLVPVGGRPMLGWVLDYLREAGVKNIAVNAHHLARQVEEYISQRRDKNLATVREAEILETGGGVLNMMTQKKEWFQKPFFALNSDCLWLNGPHNCLEVMDAFWDARRMDVLLLLYPTTRLNDSAARGDFTMSQDNRLQRRKEWETSPFVFMGVQILSPKVFAEYEAGEHFSLNRVYDAAAEKGRLFGLVHDGRWLHVGTPEQLRTAEQEIKNMEKDVQRVVL